MFLHGAGCTSEVFAAQSAAFPGSHAPNLPGHDAPGSGASVPEFAAFVRAYLERIDARHAVLAGSSLGGAIALEVALQAEPRVAGVVLLGSGARLRVAPAFLEGLEHDFDATARTIAGYLYAEATPQRVEQSVAAMRRVGPAQTLRDFRACDSFDATGRLDALHVPLLALTGEADRLTPPKFAAFLADRIASAQARIVPGAGHFVMIERPEQTNEAIRAFVTST